MVRDPLVGPSQLIEGVGEVVVDHEGIAGRRLAEGLGIPAGRVLVSRGPVVDVSEVVELDGLGDELDEPQLDAQLLGEIT